MKIKEVIDYLKGLAASPVDEKQTGDKIICGSGEEQVRKIGVSMFATPNVIREAKKQGVNLLIVHEPVFHQNRDEFIPHEIGLEKKRLIEESGITVFRNHDYAHNMEPDLIYDGQVSNMCISGTREKGKYWAVNRYILDNEMTALELAEKLEESYGIKYIRIAGCTDKKGKVVSCCFGTPGHVIDELKETDFVLTGEISEWRDAEVARDFAEMGYNKAILVLGHIGSEREGMKFLSKKLSEKFTDIQTVYIECGEVYSYTK